MISLQFILGNLLPRGELQIDAINSNFEHIWERPLYEISEYAFKEVQYSFTFDMK